MLGHSAGWEPVGFLVKGAETSTRGDQAECSGGSSFHYQLVAITIL